MIEIRALFRHFWPVLLILFGLYLVFKKKSDREPGEDFGDKTFDSDSSRVIRSNIFGDIRVNLSSRDFEGGHIRTTFGDVKVDASSLQIRSGERTLGLATTFGDIKIHVPRELPVKVTASNLAGDIAIFDRRWDGFNKQTSYQSESYEKAKSKLFIVCNLTFGDIKVT
jgi:lia operon protein LiaF